MNGGPLQFVRDVFDAGGWAMWPLLVMSLVSGALVVERLIYWLGTDRPGRQRRLRGAVGRLRAGDLAGARALVAEEGSIYGRAASALLDAPPTEGAAMAIIERERSSCERFSATLSTIITAAPLVGILGTVTGIIRSFELLGAQTAANVVDPSQVASGIAEALVTTAFGLAVAVATLFPYAWCRALSERCLSRLESLAAEIQGAREGKGGQP